MQSHKQRKCGPACQPQGFLLPSPETTGDGSGPQPSLLPWQWAGAVPFEWGCSPHLSGPLQPAPLQGDINSLAIWESDSRKGSWFPQVGLEAGSLPLMLLQVLIRHVSSAHVRLEFTSLL